MKLRVWTDNKSCTWVRFFKQAVRIHGCPHRCRGDYGKENYGVARRMARARPNVSRPFIFGRSVHNQRIEAMWSQINPGCLWFFSDLFGEMEKRHRFNPDNEIHIMALHIVFLDRIQEKLGTWKQVWNNHKIRTAQNRTPNQMIRDDCFEQPDDISDVYGIDWGTDLPQNPNVVEVPQVIDLPDDVIDTVKSTVADFDKHVSADPTGVDSWKFALLY